MANVGKWNAPTSTTMLSTGLNSLGVASVVSSSAYSNQTNLDMYADFEIVISCTPVATAFCSIYILEAIDGSNYPSPANADLRLTATQLLASIPLGTTAGNQRVVVRNVLLPPSSFKIAFDNQTGGTLSSSGNTVIMNAYDVNLNG